MLNAHSGIEHPEVVVDLGDGTHRGPGVGQSCLLLDGDGGAQAANMIVTGLVKLPQELTRIRGKRLDVPSLSLGVQSIERQ